MKFSAAVSCLLLPWVAQGHEGHGRHLQKEKTLVRPDAPVLASSPGPESSSGVHRCGTRELPSESVVKAMEAIATERIKGGAGRRLKGFSATIPVVFHLISDDGTMYTTSEKLNAQIDVLNEAFAAAGFTFELVKTTFTTNPDWFVEDDYFNMVQTLREGCKQTLNVYWYDIPDNILGFAQFPIFESNFVTDGISMLYGTEPGGAIAPYNEGDTLVHEVGHWLLLQHTFGNGSCGSDDGIADTTETAVGFGCPEPGFDSCPLYPGFDDLDNYMSYFDDPCMDTFTPLQIELMQLAWETFREDEGETCDCPISFGKGKGKGSGQSRNGRGGRELRTSNGNGKRSGGKGKKGTAVSTQTIDPTNVPPCDGVPEPGLCVKWIEVEGTGSDITIMAESLTTFTALSVFEDGCDLTCIAGFDSFYGDGSSGDAEITFASEKGVFYLVALTAFPLCDEVIVTIN